MRPTIAAPSVPTLQVNLARVARQAFAALVLVLLLAGYGVSHPAAYTTTALPTVTETAR